MLKKINFLLKLKIKKMGNKECVFCKIGETDKERILYEDEKIIIFKDRSPVSVIHLQCIPKRHIKNKNQLTKRDIELLNYMYITSREFININYNKYIMENRPIFGFHKPPFYTISHLHMHCIIPPYTNYFMKVLNCCILKDFDDVIKEINSKNDF